MDFVRLGPAYSTVYVPDKLIEGYSSLIWSERQQDFGDFELKSPLVDEMSAALPNDTLVSHLETDEVMIVESRSIEMVGEGQDARPEITIKGRSVAHVMLTHRIVQSTYGRARRMRQKYSATGAALVLMYQAVVGDSGFDLTRGDANKDTLDPNDFPWTTADKLPNVVISEDVADEGTPRWWQLENGTVYAQMAQMLVGQELGIRTKRPTGKSANIVTVDSVQASRGTLRYSTLADCTALQFNIYDGVDRTNKVKLSMLQGHIDKPEWLISNQDYSSHLDVISGTIEIADVVQPGEAAATGWKRRVDIFDAGSAEKPQKPKKPKRPKSSASKEAKDQYAANYDQYLEQKELYDTKKNTWDTDFKTEGALRSQDALKQARKVNLFAGDVSDLSPYVYGIDYDLGDLVLLTGENGTSTQMIVREYVRTEDDKGDRGIPGLAAP